MNRKAKKKSSRHGSFSTFVSPIPKVVLTQGLEVRWVVLKILDGIFFEKRTLLDLTSDKKHPFSLLKTHEKARTLSLADNVLRYLSGVDEVIECYITKKTNTTVVNILRIAFVELALDRLPAHAVVDSAVRICKIDRKIRFMSGLVNAVCRRLSERLENRICILKPNLSCDLSKKLKSIYGELVTKKISDSLSKKPLIDITVKKQRYINKFAKILQANILPTGTLRISERPQISKLKGFKEGDWWVQDSSAAIVVLTAGNLSGKKVLDVCAAPGGKTMQLISAGADVTALDISKKRLKRLKENLQRTKLKADIVHSDVLDFKPESLYDIVVVDAPCTSTGTIRRNIDLQYLYPSRCLSDLLVQQKLILENSMRFVKVWGNLIYSTCSLFPEEGEYLIQQILKCNKNWRQKKIDACKFGLKTEWVDKFGGLRLRPDYWKELGGMDGFFISNLTKIK